MHTQILYAHAFIILKGAKVKFIYIILLGILFYGRVFPFCKYNIISLKKEELYLPIKQPKDTVRNYIAYCLDPIKYTFYIACLYAQCRSISQYL